MAAIVRGYVSCRFPADDAAERPFSESILE